MAWQHVSPEVTGGF